MWCMYIENHVHNNISLYHDLAQKRGFWFPVHTLNFTEITQKQAKMKSTKVQTLGELRMRGTANWWAGLFVVCVYSWSSWRRVWHGLATVVDSMRESINARRCDFLCLRGTEQADPVVHTPENALPRCRIRKDARGCHGIKKVRHCIPRRIRKIRNPWAV